MRLVLASLLVLCSLLVPRAGHAQLRDQLYTTPVIAALPAAAVHAAAEPTLLVVFPASRTEMEAGPEGASTPALVLGGVAGGGVGLVAGLFLGAVLDGEADPDCIDFCFGPGLLIGLLTGEALGVSAGVHLANGRRGSLPLSALTTAGMVAVALVAGNDHPEMLLVVPVGQLVGAIWMERGTARRR